MKPFSQIKRTPEELLKQALRQEAQKQVESAGWPTGIKVVIEGVGEFTAKPIASVKNGRIMYNLQGTGVGPGQSGMKIAGNLFTDFGLENYDSLVAKYLPGRTPAAARNDDEAELEQGETTE